MLIQGLHLFVLLSFRPRLDFDCGQAILQTKMIAQVIRAVEFVYACTARYGIKRNMFDRRENLFLTDLVSPDNYVMLM